MYFIIYEEEKNCAVPWGFSDCAERWGGRHKNTSNNFKQLKYKLTGYNEEKKM